MIRGWGNVKRDAEGDSKGDGVAELFWTLTSSK